MFSNVRLYFVLKKYVLKYNALQANKFLMQKQFCTCLYMYKCVLFS